MTREQLLAQLAQRRARRINLNWGQFISMFNSLSQPERDQLLTAANNGDARTVFAAVYGLLNRRRLELATEEVDTAAANDSLTIDELIALFS